MRRTLLGLLALGCLAGGVVSTQMPMGFITTVQPLCITPGSKVTLKGTFLDPRVQQFLADPHGYFLVGVFFDPRRAPIVFPPILLGRAPFKKVKVGNRIVLQATLTFQAPQVKLPPRFRLRLFFQAVAFLKHPRTKRVHPVFARPAAALFASRCR